MGLRNPKIHLTPRCIGWVWGKNTKRTRLNKVSIFKTIKLSTIDLILSRWSKLWLKGILKSIELKKR